MEDKHPTPRPVVQPERVVDDHKQQAEELVDQASLMLSGWLGQAGHFLSWTANRAREEAEDIYAEAEQLRDTWRD